MREDQRLHPCLFRQEVLLSQQQQLQQNTSAQLPHVSVLWISLCNWFSLHPNETQTLHERHKLAFWGITEASADVHYCSRQLFFFFFSYTSLLGPSDHWLHRKHRNSCCIDINPTCGAKAALKNPRLCKRVKTKQNTHTHTHTHLCISCSPHRSIHSLPNESPSRVWRNAFFAGITARRQVLKRHHLHHHHYSLAMEKKTPQFAHQVHCSDCRRWLQRRRGL